MVKRLWLLMLFSLCVTPNAWPQYCDNNLFSVIKDEKLGFIDKSGREVIRPRFSDRANIDRFPNLPEFHQGLAPVSENGRWGYIDCLGNFAIPPQFSKASPFSEGVASVEEGDRPLWIDRTGRVLHVGKLRQFGYEFHEGMMLLADDQNPQSGYMDKNFKWIIPSRPGLFDNFHEGFAQFSITNAMSTKVGFINHSGTLAIPAKYDNASAFSDGLARVCVNVAIETISTPQAYKGRCGFVDSAGREVIKLQFRSVTSFSDGCAVVEPESGVVQPEIIDKEGRVLAAVPANRTVLRSFHEGLVAVETDRSYGYIDCKGAWIIPPQFSYAGDFSKGLALVEFTLGDYAYIGKNGNVVWRARREIRVAF